MDSKRNRFVASALFLILAIFSAEAQTGRRTLIASSGASHVELLELFTSEGCSSCPPADEWISQLKNQDDLWKNYIPVVFHVDYWNGLGWKDELSSPAMTQRQSDLANQWSQPSVYTPGVVLDGKEWRGWRSVRNPPASSGNPRQIKLSLFRETDGSFTVKVERPKASPSLVIRIAELGMGMSSNVTRGENSGKILKHNFAVLDWSGKTLAGGESEKNFQFKSPSQRPPQTAIAAWVEEPGNPTPLQAVGGYL